MIPPKAVTAAALGRLPWTAELYQRWRGRGEPPATGYRLDRLKAALPGWVESVRKNLELAKHGPSSRVLVFAYLSWWIEHATLLSLFLASAGHRVSLVTLPFRRWTVDPPGFDLRRQRAYLEGVLQPAASVIGVGDLAHRAARPCPPSLEAVMERQAQIDLQYTLQREDIAGGRDTDSRALHQLRLGRNRRAAQGALAWIERTKADTVVIPNGSILEFGAVFHAARSRQVHVSTYEFGEQRERIWVAQDSQVMRQDTADLWKARGSTPLTDGERDELERMYRARRSGASWANFARQWQSGESEGAAAARARLSLEPSRPTVLICTNVIGDSLALDRQVFTQGMSEWLGETVRHLSSRPEAQVVVRIHPGELLGAGHPSQEIVRSSLPSLPEHIRVVAPDDPLNTYDLMELADIGLVYTTTAGMEMAMGGVPVAVAGQTHYRGRGFTADPESWSAYFETLDRWLANPGGARLSPDRMDLARRYAYRYFFEYPLPFPWHLIRFWDDVGERPLAEVLRPENLSRYRRTLDALVGDPIEWGAE